MTAQTSRESLPALRSASADTGPHRRRASRSRRERRWRVLGVALAAVGAIPIALVLYYAVTTSLKTPSDALSTPIQWIPKTLEWSTYSQPFQLVDFGRYLMNSCLVGAAVTLLNLITCTLAGYSLAKFRFPGRGVFFALVLGTLMIPIEVIYVPLFQLVYQLGWVNSYMGLILPAGTSAFGIFLMRQAMVNIPNELLEAARVDGAGELRILFRIALPMVRGPLATLSLFIFMTNWDSFLWPLIVASDDQYRTVPVGLAAMQGQFSTSFPTMMAAALISMAPTVGLFLVLQRRFVEGVMATASQK